MRANSLLCQFLFAGTLFLFAAESILGADADNISRSSKAKNGWHGKLRDGTIITTEDLSKINYDHKLWLETGGKSGKRADFRGAKLSGAFLGLENWSKADFSGADLSGSDFVGADLRGAEFARREIVPLPANLREAKFSVANLSGAELAGVDLSGAEFYSTNMAGADVFGIKVYNATFELMLGKPLPDILGLASAAGLAQLKYSQVPTTLIEMRDAFEKAGMGKCANEVNYAIMHTRRTAAPLFEKILLLAIELPCAYGLKPGRPLLLLFAAIFVFWIPYGVALGNGTVAGIWIAWPEDRVPRLVGEENTRLSLHGFHRIAIALYFSLLSAFNIGWEEINIGAWIARLQPRQFTLAATGWVRVVAGVQSLVGLYMVVLAILSYFGHHFE